MGDNEAAAVWRGGTREIESRHGSIQRHEPAATDTAVALDAAPVAKFTARHEGIDVEPVREAMDEAVEPAHHSHPTSQAHSTIATQSPADSATMTGSATSTGRRASVSDASMCRSVRAVMLTSVVAQ